MQVLSTCVIVALAVAGVSASPHRDRPSRPSRISVHKPQVNMCGNGVSPYCCDNAAEGNQHGGEVDCKPLGMCLVLPYGWGLGLDRAILTS